mmetsp:Transcript_35432/g.56926  ORF Transcript_35432/g.56926 Transcript_35432/m.56926 type:complete len:247 (-) Transcript_35432:243-983(-)|eukprot:jgi/Bigna1/81076/fgenesh1_pg.77_\
MSICFPPFQQLTNSPHRRSPNRIFGMKRGRQESGSWDIPSKRTKKRESLNFGDAKYDAVEFNPFDSKRSVRRTFEPQRTKIRSVRRKRGFLQSQDAYSSKKIRRNPTSDEEPTSRNDCMNNNRALIPLNTPALPPHTRFGTSLCSGSIVVPSGLINKSSFEPSPSRQDASLAFRFSQDVREAKDTCRALVIYQPPETLFKASSPPPPRISLASDTNDGAETKAPNTIEIMNFSSPRSNGGMEMDEE